LLIYLFNLVESVFFTEQIGFILSENSEVIANVGFPPGEFQYWVARTVLKFKCQLKLN